MSDVSPPAQLALLLMARWATAGTQPLSNGEFADFHRWMDSVGVPAQSILERQVSLESSPITPERLTALLNRTVGVFQSINKWLGAGLWICYWRDPCYPSRFKTLKHRAPILLFGYGDANAFGNRALAIVGSRNASEERLNKASEIGRACARSGITVVSGGAKGIDSAAMSAGIAGMGTVVGVMADSLLRESGKSQYRQAIQEGRLCLMSEVHPEARFDVGMAMARNRLAYACAEAALVIECDLNKGGTWAGAMEALRAGSPVYVLQGARAERALVEKGAISVGIDFALNPVELVQGHRPAELLTPSRSKVDLIVWELLNSQVKDEDLESHIQTNAGAVARALRSAAVEDGWVLRAIDEPTLGPATVKKRKPRKKVGVAESPGLFVHEERLDLEQTQPEGRELRAPKS